MSSFVMLPALRAGRAYMLAHQDADGLWRDFITLAGESSDWVTGYVAHCLGSVLVDMIGHEEGAQDRLADAVSRASRELVRRQRPNGGWSYNSTVPTDADSTAWALLALADQPEWRPSSAVRASRYLLSHWDPARGGFTTYAAADEVHRFISAPEPLTIGWRLAQPCVTAAVVRALLAAGRGTAETEAGLAFTRATQDSDGLWRSYWWAGPGYPTYQALSALASGRALDDPTRASLERGLAGALCEDDAFELGHAVLTATLLGKVQAARTGAERLAAAQRADGSWAASGPILRIPPPQATDTSDVDGWAADGLGTGVLVSDNAHLFTTATVLAALAAFMNRTTAR